MVECDVCGEDIGDEGWLVHFKDGRRGLYCLTHFTSNFQPGADEMLFHWGGDEPDPPCPLVHHAIIKISAESRTPIDYLIDKVYETYRGETNVSVSITIGREP